MNYELFVAKRIISGKEYKSSISSPIIKIAITAISLGLVIMLIAIATGGGLREKIRSKISGFKGHIQITKYDANNSDVSVIPIDKNQNFYPKFTNIKGVKNIQRQWFLKYKKWITIRPMTELGILQYQFLDEGDNSL